MFLSLFTALKQAGIPVSIREYLLLLEAMDRGAAGHNTDDFYFLARATLVKDERNIDRFDAVFASVIKGLVPAHADGLASIPEEWLRKLAEKHLTEEEKALLQTLGGLDRILEELAKRLAEQKGRHQGGSKWVGTAGTSPFGAYGYNPEGVRIGQKDNRSFRAVKVWDRREFRDLDGDVELGTRAIKLALRRLRQFARSGAPEEFDLDQTIRATAGQGFLDVRYARERRNAIKVLLLFDSGGSMSPFVTACEELFSAARAEFRHLEFFYFHNCVYESVWRSNARRHTERLPTFELMRTYGGEHKLIFVGDAAMGPYELTHPGGSVEHHNEEPGLTWISRLTERYRHAVWLNPVPETQWSFSQSSALLRRVLGNRMYPLTLDGLDRAMAELKR